MALPLRRSRASATSVSASNAASEAGVDQPMREYIRDMLSGLSTMAEQAQLHDLSALLRVAVRGAKRDAEAEDKAAAALSAALRD